MLPFFFHTNRKVDIAVFKLSEKVSQSVEVPDEYQKHKDYFQKLLPVNGISMDSMFTLPPMEVFFFGFPLGNLGQEIFGIKLPLVKKAIISGWINHHGIDLLFLDGHNNPGFSGGSVVAYDTITKKICVIGVISGYVPEPIDVKNNKTTLSVNANSGVMICYDKLYINKIFDTNKKYLIRRIER